MRSAALEAVAVAYLFFPLLGGAVFNGLCIRFGWLKALARPVDHGATLGGRRLFGPNKTYRGFFCFGVGSAVLAAVQHTVVYRAGFARSVELYHLPAGRAALFGLGLGLAATLAELPNSMMKRRVGVEPGSQAAGLWRPVFYVVDQVDLLLGSWLVLALVVAATPGRILLSIAAMLVLHPLVNVIGYALRLRRTLQ